MTAGFGTGHMTTTTHSVFIPDLWSKQAQVARESKLVTAKRVLRFDAEVNYGDSIKIPLFSNPTPVAKSASTAVTFQSTANESSVTLSIDQYYEVSYLLEDIVAKQSKIDLEPLIKQKCGYGLAKQIDTSLNTLAASFSQTVGDFASGTVTEDIILRAVQYLDDADAPEDDRSLIIKPALRSAMLKLEKFSSSDYVGNADPVVKKIFGDIYGVPAFVTTNVYASGTSVSNMMIHKEALACAVQKNISVEKGRIIEYVADAYVATCVWGKVEYRDDHGVEIRS